MPESLVFLTPAAPVTARPLRSWSPASRLGVLRLSITDRCNFRCRYCMPEEGVPKVAHASLLPLERLAEMVEWLVAHSGIHRVRLTGGEPLVRRGVVSLVGQLSRMRGIDEVSLTTNGTRLPQLAPELKAAGLTRVNISLDTLAPERFREVTRGGSLADTLAGIAAAQKAGLTPIRLNTVLRRSTWERDVPQLLDYAAATGFEIRFIELMRTGTERAWCESEFVAADEVCEYLEVCEYRGAPASAPGAAGAAPARRTRVMWRGTPLPVGWITPRSHPFCSRCDRLRMDARGQLRRCLMDPAQMDLNGLLAIDEEAAAAAFSDYLAAKLPPAAMDNVLAMSQIGG